MHCELIYDTHRLVSVLSRLLALITVLLSSQLKSLEVSKLIFESSFFLFRFSGRKESNCGRNKIELEQF